MGSETTPRTNMISEDVNGEEFPVPPGKRVKLHGRAFYESIGSPRVVLAPMVEQSEFAWRLLTRSFLPDEKKKELLAYTPMFHSRMFHETPKYRDSHFQPRKEGIPALDGDDKRVPLTEEEWHLDGHPAIDRPLTVQFCSNNPDDFLTAARQVAPYCDAVDLNLGCPQGIARRGNYGAFLQEDKPLIVRMIGKLHEELDIPVTAKMRVLETKEQTLEYAKMILDAGASILTVHGRRREQKGHNTGLADWGIIRYLREQLPRETVLFANGNILQKEDIDRCLEETGADAVMSAEGNLYDPTIFADPPPVGEEGREYWRGRDGKGGYRMDAVMRRYMNIIHKYGLGVAPPERAPLFLPSDPEPPSLEFEEKEDVEDGPPRKKMKQAKGEKKQQQIKNPNLTAMQAHLFHLLRPLVAQHHNVRDALAKCRVGDIEAFENVLTLVEKAVKEALVAYEKEHTNDKLTTTESTPPEEISQNGNAVSNGNTPTTTIPTPEDPYESSLATVARCKRPWWVCQPYVRPLPKEAIEKGSMQLSKKEKKKLEMQEAEARAVGLEPGGRAEKEKLVGEGERKTEVVEIPRDGMVCG